MVSNLQKKVLITPGLYFPNCCIMYLPHDISRDFKKCEHVNLDESECVEYAVYTYCVRLC